MDVREYRTVDKSTWGDGPWQHEPDKRQWQDEASGLPCLIVRNVPGALCGYVGVPRDHPYFGKSYDDCDVRVHGGLTYAAPCSHAGDEARAICHAPGIGETDDVFWLGFDCSHHGDLMPGLNVSVSVLKAGATYRTIDWVTEECAKLAHQLMLMQAVHDVTHAFEQVVGRFAPDGQSKPTS